MDENGDTSSALEGEIVILKNKGNGSLMAGHFIEAIQMYTEAMSLSSKPNAILLSNRSQALIKIENYGLAIVDATAAIETDPNYPKGYYRRGTALFAINKTKDARKDFKAVCKLVPNDKDARSRLAECEKIIKETAFAAAITSVETAPLSETYDAKNIPIENSYDGPYPSLDEKEDLFVPGSLPRDFVMV
jgi:serine/threonine-protein phosphatase 5